MKKPSLFRAVAVLSVLFGIALALANAVLGPLNQDEGVYLLAARFTANGRAPYEGYFCTQGPFLPYFYALFQRFWFHPGSVLGVLLSARLFTAFLGLGACGLASGLAYLLVPDKRNSARLAALATWLFTACSPVHSYFTAIPKTYALTSLLFVAGFLCLAFLSTLRSSPDAALATRRTPLAFNAGVFLGLAAATRLSFAFALPATCLSLWLAAPRGNRRQGFLDAFYLALGALFVLALSVGRSLYFHFDDTLACIGVHAAREGGALLPWLSLRAGFLSRTFQAYPLLWAAAAVYAGIALFPVPKARRGGALPPVAVAMGASVLFVTLVHVLAPLPYDDYQTPLMPVFAALVAVLLLPRLASVANPETEDGLATPATPATPATILFLLSLVFSLSSPLLMDWVSLRKDRFWFDMKSRPDVLVLRDAGRDVRALHESLGGTGNLLTQDAYLAVESGLPVSPRLALGPFSFHLGPDSDETCRRLLLNEGDFQRMLTSPFPAPVAATSGYTFAIDYPSTARVPEEKRQKLLDDLARFYEPVKTVPDFGQDHTGLTLWRRRAEPGAMPDAQ